MMQSHHSLTAIAAALALLYAFFWHWQAPGSSNKLTQAEIAGYLTLLESELPMPADEKQRVLTRLRAWGEADDGKPVLMLNLMRYYDQIRPMQGAPAITATPKEANHYYEGQVASHVAKLGAYPLISGNAVGIGENGKQHSNVFGFGQGLDDWDRIIVMRYPSRRAFFRLVSDPEYLKIVPYKLVALQLGLAPLKSEVIVPDLRFALAALFLILFLGTGWWRAVGHRPPD